MQITIKALDLIQRLPFYEMQNDRLKALSLESKADYFSINGADDKVMGGRFRFSNEKIDFTTNIGVPANVREIYSMLNNEDTVIQLLSDLATDNPMSELKPLISYLLTKATFDPYGAAKQKSLSARLRRRAFRWPIIKQLLQPKIFLHFDYSVAGNGYEREPHRDGLNRLAAGLIYLNEISGGIGGEFTIYQHQGPDRHSRKRQPSPDEITLIASIKPKQGLGFIFLSDSDSYHGVSLMKDYPENTLRAFCYFGVSTDYPITE